MYKKKSYVPYIVTGLALIGLIIGFFFITKLTSKPKEVPETEVTTEAVEEIPKHQILIHKTNAGTLEFEQKWLKSDSDTKTMLEVEESTLVSMRIKPMDGKYLETVNIYDAKSVNTAISNVITKLDGGDYNIDFTMPQTDIVMTFQFNNVEVPITEAPQEPESEPETEGTPYGLKLHGVTADVITSFNGQFDDQDFLQQLGSSLHVDSARSSYHKVTDVTFSTEEYKESKDSDKVYYYIYFNDDPNWKVLSTYYLKEHAYVFTEPAVKETEPETQATQTPAAQTQPAGQTSYQPTNPTQGEPTTTVVASLDIMAVSSNFLEYTGGTNSKFYDEIFNYVVEEKGQTGTLTGTMESYKINPKKQKATIHITLNTGATIKATYNKAKNTYSFSGL